MRDNLLARETYLSADNNIKKYISQNSKDKEEEPTSSSKAYFYKKPHLYAICSF